MLFLPLSRRFSRQRDWAQDPWQGEYSILSEPRSVNTFCFMSEGEQCCSWSYVAIETQEKQSKGSLLYEIDYSLFQGVGQQNTTLLCLLIRAAVSVLFQEYSELNKDLLGSFPALFTTIWCGRFCAFWLHFLTVMWEFIYLLTVPIQRNCGHWVEWTLRTPESSHFCKATCRALHWRKVTFWQRYEGVNGFVPLYVMGPQRVAI